MNDESCLNFNAIHSLDKKSTSNDARLYHSDESNNFYLKLLNENKKNSELESKSHHYQNYAKDIERLKNQNEALAKERNGLKQQCRAAIHQWEKTLLENNEAKDQLAQMQQQRDEALKKLNHEISQRFKAAKDLTRLTEERNSAVQEYNLIMSERDTVHKEMEKLNEELAQYQKKIRSLDSEKKSLLEEIDHLKNKITNRTLDKEQLIKQMYKERSGDFHFNANSFQQGLRSINSNTAKWGSSSSGFSSGWTQFGKHPLSLSSTNSNIHSLHTFNQIDVKQQHFSISNSSSVSTMGNNKSKSELSDNELELRKQIQALEYEYNNVHIDFRNCLLQNEKVVQERESIKTLCDKLRRERDRAIRDRAEVLQDLDDFKMKIESNAQIKKYMDDLNEMNNLSDQTKKQTNNASSKDSAISADIQDLPNDYENLNILLVNNFRHNNSKYKNVWGFSIRSQDKSIVVSGINIDSPAEEKLKLNDIVLSINSTSVTDEQLCNELLCKYDKDLQLVIQRKRQLSSVLNINLDCFKNEHGLVLENAFLIKKLLPDSVADKNENISVGDRLLSINGNTLENSTIHDVMQLLREGKLLLKVYKQGLNNQNASSVVLNQKLDDLNEQSSNKFLNNLRPTYQKDDLHLTTSGKQSSYSPNIGHYQSIKRSSKKSKALLNDSSSSFGTEYDKLSSPTLLDKTFNKLFKKSIKKNEKKDEKLRKNSPEKETLDDFNKIINNLSEKDSKKKLFANRSTDKDKTNSNGTWPSCKSNTNLLSSPTYDKVNHLSSTTYSKKKERKSLAIFANYSKNNDTGKSTYGESMFENAKDLEPKTKLVDNYSKDYKNFNDYQQYGMIQSNKTSISSRVNTPALENIYKSIVHNHGKHNERCLSSSVSSYSSKDNYYRSNNGKKYTLNHDVIYKSFNAPSSSSSIQTDQDYQIKKSKEKKYLDSINKQKLMFDQPTYTDLQDEKSYKDHLFQLTKCDPNSSFGLYSITNKRQLIANQTSNYTSDIDAYLNNSSTDQGLTGSADVDTASTTNPYLLSNIDNLINQKKSSPININQLKALNRLSITSSSPSYHLNENLLSNSPSSHYATFSTNNAQQSNKDNYYYTTKQNIYERSNLPVNSNPSSNIYGYINPTSPLHQSSNPVESVSSLSSNIYHQDDFLAGKNQRFHISSNNSVASKLSNCSMDSNSLHSDAINSSSNYFKKAATNESLDSTSYSNMQILRNPVELLNRKKNLSLDKKLIPNKQVQQMNKKQINLSIDKTSTDCDSKVFTNRLDVYSADCENTKPGEIRSICIEKSKEKSLGIQIECGRANNGKINSPGIFVSCVNEGSLAKKVGLKVGDQLLEICGINMRSANKDAAASVLRQCGQTVMMKVQYNPDKFLPKESMESNQMTQSDSTELNNKENKIERETNLDRQSEEDKEDEKLEDTLKNFNMNVMKANLADNLISTETIDKEDDSYSEKCLYF